MADRLIAHGVRLNGDRLHGAVDTTANGKAIVGFSTYEKAHLAGRLGGLRIAARRASLMFAHTGHARRRSIALAHMHEFRDRQCAG